jgi:type I restriction enzyme S subunit
MKWEKVKLGELYEVHNGLSKAGKFFGEGYPFLTFSTVFNNYFIPKQITDLVQSTEKEQESYSIRRGDVFVTRTSETSDELGMSCVALKDYPMATYNGFTKRMRPITNRVFPEYIGYYMRLPSFRGEFRAFSTMTTRASLRNEDLLGLEVKLPSIEIQKQIAGILSVYDDLIENNQKQIKLLEEAAQRLYKEWFVDLHFPGHENTKIVDGVPEGWNICPFSSKVDIMSGGTPKTSIPDYYNGRIPFYTPKDSDGAFFAYKTQMNITEGGLKNCSSRLYPPKTVIITARGTVGKTTILAVPMAMNQSCYALKMKENDAPYYLFFALNNEIKALQTMANGGVFNTIIGKTFDSINIQIPKDPLIYGFEETVRPFMEQIKNKLQANSKLVEARDRLLPKLMSGEVEV